MTIRGPRMGDYHQIKAILLQVQNLHVQMRPDIYAP